jgi:hypothetical protein
MICALRRAAGIHPAAKQLDLSSGHAPSQGIDPFDSLARIPAALARTSS